MENHNEAVMLIEVRFADGVKQWTGYDVDAMTPLMCTRYGVDPEYAGKWAVVAAYTPKAQKPVADLVEALKHAEEHGVSEVDFARWFISGADLSEMATTQISRPGE